MAGVLFVTSCEKTPLNVTDESSETKKTEDATDDIEIGGEGMQPVSNHLMDKFVVPSELEIKPVGENAAVGIDGIFNENAGSLFKEAGLQNALINIYLFNNSTSFSKYSEDAKEVEEFEKIAQKFGDVSFGDTIYHAANPYFMAQYTTIANVITKIEVTALNDYNEKYPKGSSLTDIAKISYGTLQPYVDNNYELPSNENHSPYKAERRVNTQYGASEREFIYLGRPLSENFEISMPTMSAPDVQDVKNGYEGGRQLFATMSFSEAPSSEENLAFEISVTFDDGRVLKTTMGK